MAIVSNHEQQQFETRKKVAESREVFRKENLPNSPATPLNDPE
jgi:hypothetical protein